MFATVLGLIAWIYLAAEVTVYCAEINVVLARRLWPRAIVQPPLTEADRASMALQALQNQRRPEQHIEVTFDDRGPTRPRRPGRRRRRTRLRRLGGPAVGAASAGGRAGLGQAARPAAAA